MRVAAIVLAAGEGRRLGGPKALLRLGGESFLARACRLLAEGGLEAVIAVLGAEAETVRAMAGLPASVRVRVNQGWRAGMLSSICLGLEQAERLGAQAVLVHPVDHPLVEPSTIAGVREALLAGAQIAVPTFAGRRGHPAGFGAALFEAIRRAPPEVGARAVLAAHAERVVSVPGDAGCVAGVNLPEDLARLSALPAAARRG